MAKKAPLWKGSKDIHLQPGFPEFFNRGDSEGYRLAYRGPFQKLLATRPRRGGFIANYHGYYVQDVSIKPDGAGKTGPGTMLVTVESVVDGGTTSPDAETVIEIDSGTMDRNLLRHPKFISITAGEAKQVRDLVDEGAPLPNPEARDDITNLYELWRRGVESFMDDAPVVRKTSYSTIRPTVQKIGLGTRTTEKPHPDAPDGWQWLKISDRAQRSGRGKWERVEVWQAATEWSEYIYGPDAAE